VRQAAVGVEARLNRVAALGQQQFGDRLDAVLVDAARPFVQQVFYSAEMLFVQQRHRQIPVSAR
jgi:hypothetical protein